MIVLTRNKKFPYDDEARLHTASLKLQEAATSFQRQMNRFLKIASPTKASAQQKAKAASCHVLPFLRDE